MITIETVLDKNIDTLKWLNLSPQSCLFFDIETTGFAANNSQLYLIGIVYFKNFKWHATQWFADTFSSEEEILKTFFDFIKPYSYLISFNGDGFDIPYLTKKALSFGIESGFDKIQSIDILKSVRLFKTLLNLENYKQKSIELFLELHREDRYNGGELIEVYHQYLKTHDEEAYRLLLLHNAEDIAGMPDILPILAYGRLTDTSYCGHNVPNAVLTDFSINEETQEAIFILSCDVNFPKPLKLSRRTMYLTVSGNTINLRIRLYHGELKHFYPNYRDYYYLPAEDMAIHKSVAQFVESEFRQKAKASNCYTKKEGFFLLQSVSGDVIEPVFCKEYKDKELYLLCSEDFTSNTATISSYAISIMGEFIK